MPRKPTTGRRALTDAEYAALGDFRWSMRQFLHFSDDGAREQGLSSQQHQALLAIRSHPGPEAMTIGGLADRLLIKNHSALELVARMADGGLVERSVSQEDRRRTLLRILPRGVAILEAISLRNLGQLKETADILADILETVRRLDRHAARTAAGDPPPGPESRS
ncbi:MAG: MarR family winged helix-turn-helix transcriptional regulator [Caulobacterales bacterium]|jgi:DNA-binding MarR family transcriptional regulator